MEVLLQSQQEMGEMEADDPQVCFCSARFIFILIDCV